MIYTIAYSLVDAIEQIKLEAFTYNIELVKKTFNSVTDKRLKIFSIEIKELDNAQTR